MRLVRSEKTRSPPSPNLDISDGYRTCLLTGNRGIGRILEPVAFLQPVDHTPRERRKMARNALHLRIGYRINDDIIAEPVDTDLADFFGVCGKDCGA